jgi:hypothetical protein
MLARLLIAVTITFAAALPARAQSLIGMSPAEAEALMGAALDAPYGQLHLKNFVAAVRRDGDAACLQAEALDDAALVARGRALLQRYGVEIVKVLNENFNRAAFQAALQEAGEPDAAAEIKRLDGDPAVQKFIELYRPARLAKLLSNVTEQFDRYVLIARIKLYAISPIARGEPDSENPTEAIEAAVQKHLDEHPSDEVERYLDLQDAVEAAMPKGFRGSAKNIGPMAFLAGADRDLAELCVGKR